MPMRSISSSDFDHIAGRTGYGRHNGRVALRQQIEEARLAHIWRPGQYDLDAFTQRCGAVRLGQRATHPHRQIIELASDFVHRLLGDVGLIGEIDSRLDAPQY
ncbi:MAG: hypothetical protein E6G87_14080 [Alphaproteobacteria bacterium]|nr:MAG: hypothetical protein E6G87_14080 [Alphaproteobacteria bacterium]